MDPPSVSANPLQSRQIVELQAQQHLLLDRADCGFVVREGYLAIYLVRLSGGQPSGARQYLFSCHEGSALYGTTLTQPDGNHVLLATAIESCRVECNLFGAGSEEEVGTGFLAGLHNWVQHLCELMGERLRSAYSEHLEPGAETSYHSGQVFRTTGFGLRVLQIKSGAFYLPADESLSISAADTPALTLTSELALRVRSAEAQLRFVDRTSMAAADIGEVLAGVLALTRLFIAERVHLREVAAKAELARFERLAARSREERREAVAFLNLHHQCEPQHGEAPASPLMNALEALGRQIGVRFAEDPAAAVRNSRSAQIEAIARVSDTRARRVKLVGKWWKNDVGHLLAFRKDGGAPVALILASTWLGMKRSYEWADGETGMRQPLTAELAATLDDNAYVFLRPLPMAEKISVPGLAKSVMLPFLPDFRLMFLLSILSGLLGLAMPLASFIMIDRVIPDANESMMVDLALGLMAMSVGLFLFGLSTGLLSIRIKTALTAQLQSAIIDRLLRLPARFFRRYSSGDVLNRAMMISEISAGMSMTAINSLLSLIAAFFMLSICFHFSARLAFLALIAALFSSIFSLSFSFLTRSKALGIEAKSGELFGFVVQMISGVTKLQIAGADQRAFNQWARRYGEQLRESYAIAELQHWSGMINMIIQTGSTIALYYLAGTMVAETVALQAVSPLTPPLLTIGTFFAFQSAFGSVVGGIVGFFDSFLGMYQQMAKRDLVRPILEEPVECGRLKTDPGRLEGHIQIQNVVFRYQRDGQKVLDGLSVRALPGEFIAIVGQSGSGKSTILRLLLGFDFPESGQVLFDKKDVNDLDMLAVRRQIGVVLQDGKINAGTVYHAICGAASLSMDEAWEAAEAAGFADEIKSFPMGMHTILSEGATTLSGGQRQRLLIARALATRPRLVFFDEATSALDNRTQAIVTESLKRRRITRVVIAHRLSTIIDADRIYVLENGSISQSGSYAELMAQDGLFQRLAQRQLA